MNIRDYKTAEERRKALEKELRLSLPHIAHFSLDEKTASTRNCENMIGAIQVPIGIAGPLKVLSSQFSVHSYFVPLATTEGALIASISRGCKAISESGGVTVITKKIGITRAPVFTVKNILEGQKLIQYVEKQFAKLKKVAEETSSHLVLLDIKPWVVGKNVYLRLRFDTQDAMGMNMATIATTKVVAYIEKLANVKCTAISSNMCVDKKPNYLNFIEGRGIQVWADIVIPENVISSVLKTSAEKMTEVGKRKLIYGSILSGTIGSNAHMANVLSAIFLATGQDVAHVSECATGITTIEIHEGANKDLYASVYLPDLVIGTVGGGTNLSTQRECLSIMGLQKSTKGENVEKFAQIIGGTVLAGELSLLASLSEGTLANAHQKLGRGNIS